MRVGFRGLEVENLGECPDGTTVECTATVICGSNNTNDRNLENVGHHSDSRNGSGNQ